MTIRLSKVDDFIKITWMFIPVKILDDNVKHMNIPLYLIKSGQRENEILMFDK